MFKNIFGQIDSFRQGEFQVTKTIFKDPNCYESNIHEIPDLIIPQNTWTFDLYISIQVYESQTHVWSSPVEYIKYHIEGIKTNVGWDLKNLSNKKIINFFVKKNGIMTYSSEKNCTVKYKLLLN